MDREQKGTSTSTGPEGRADEPPTVPGAGPGDPHAIPHLEFDESVPPRPEEEIADAARSDEPAS